MWGKQRRFHSLRTAGLQGGQGEQGVGRDELCLIDGWTKLSRHTQKLPDKKSVDAPKNQTRATGFAVRSGRFNDIMLTYISAIRIYLDTLQFWISGIPFLS